MYYYTGRLDPTYLLVNMWSHKKFMSCILIYIYVLNKWTINISSH